MKVNNREKIITILKGSDNPISGEEISKTLYISRTAVWKNIKKLVDEGYTITSSSTGYLLKKEDDLLIPYEFDKESDLYIYKESAESTMDIARELVKKGKTQNGTVVVTDIQTKGQGKYGKEFVSPKGGLYFTMTILNKVPIMDINLIPMAGVIAIKEVLLNELNLETTSKWPFETWYNGEKISGILPEYCVQKNYLKWLNLGVGLKLKESIPRREILIKLKKRIFKLLENRETILPQYINCIGIIGKKLKFRYEDKITVGRVLSIDKLGTLSIKNDHGLEFAYMGNSTQEEIDEN